MQTFFYLFLGIIIALLAAAVYLKFGYEGKAYYRTYASMIGALFSGYLAQFAIFSII